VPDQEPETLTTLLTVAPFWGLVMVTVVDRERAGTWEKANSPTKGIKLPIAPLERERESFLEILIYLHLCSPLLLLYK